MFADNLEIRKVNAYRAPRDKIICILNCCKVIFGLLRHATQDESADHFIPLIIYIVLQANVPDLISNLQYIQRFRNPEKLNGEEGYYLSSLLGAVEFIEMLEKGSLTIPKANSTKMLMKQSLKSSRRRKKCVKLTSVLARS